MMLDNLIIPYDYIIILVTILISIFCFWKGFIQSILGLLTWVGSIFITIYTYDSFANYLTSRLLNISFFQSYEFFTNILSIILSIPLIFLISLFILKRIRKFLSSDLDQQILGIIFDKIFGFLYGLLFTYATLTAIIILLNKFEFIDLIEWLKINSFIIANIDLFNENYIYLIQPIE
tara:strand:- start:57 stop:587 length:531 start_codon:yes stop_codon:yes gene_type:complete